MRVFLGLALPEVERKHLAALAQGAGLAPPRWRPAHVDTLHLTLRFLGEVDPGQVPLVVAAAQRAVKGAQPFSWELGDLVGIPHRQRARVAAWEVAGGADQAAALARRLEEELAREGFAREVRPFLAHVTAARAARGEEGSVPQATAAGTRLLAAEVTVWESLLGRPHAVHRPLARVALGGGGE
jgi:2'-5' RNA ligase